MAIYPNLFTRLIANSNLPSDQLESIGCWLWTGYTYRGYGMFSIRVEGNPRPRSERTHRGMEQLLTQAEAQAAADDAVPGPWWSPLPPPLPPIRLDPKATLDHLCWQRGCCNPDHWESVTAAENTRRMNARQPT